MKNRILVVDDDRDVCDVLIKNLISFGYEASSVFNGLEGIEMIKNYRYDLIILDLKLPDLYGTDVLKQIRSFNKDIIIIILTAYPSIEAVIEVFKNNQASDFICKPFDINHLRIVIQQEFKNRSTKDELRLVKMTDIGKRIKELRIKKRLSLDTLALESELSKSFLSELERRKKFPRLDTLQRISRALKTDVYLFFKE